jgi:hypothetical protein
MHYHPAEMAPRPANYHGASNSTHNWRLTPKTGRFVWVDRPCAGLTAGYVDRHTQRLVVSCAYRHAVQYPKPQPGRERRTHR